MAQQEKPPTKRMKLTAHLTALVGLGYRQQNVGSGSRNEAVTR